MAIERKKKACKGCGELRYIFSKGKCKVCSSKGYKKRPKKKSEKQKLNEKLTKIFHLWVRLSNTNSEGMVYCFTSGVQYHYKDLDAGHFISGTKINTRWDERNVFPQSITDNRFRHGRYKEYKKRLIEVHGEEWVEKLIKDSKSVGQPTVSKLKSLIKKYEKKLAEFKPCSYIGNQYGEAKVLFLDPAHWRRRICLIDGKYRSLTINQICRLTKDSLKKKKS